MPWGKDEMKCNYEFTLSFLFFLAKDDVSGFQVEDAF